MKACRRCGLNQPLEAFHRHNRAKDGRQHWCKQCKIALAQAWNALHPLRLRQRAAERYRRKRDTLDQHKSKPCADCGTSYPPYVMDFDHVRGDKVNNVSQMMSWSLTRLQREIAKCDVVCSNCHRERTFGTNPTRKEQQ